MREQKNTNNKRRNGSKIWTQKKRLSAETHHFHTRRYANGITL